MPSLLRGHLKKKPSYFVRRASKGGGTALKDMRQDPARNYISENSLPDRIRRWIIGIIHLKYTETGINLETLVFPFLLIIYVIDICQPDDITRSQFKTAYIELASSNQGDVPFLECVFSLGDHMLVPVEQYPILGSHQNAQKGDRPEAQQDGYAQVVQFTL